MRDGWTMPVPRPLAGRYAFLKRIGGTQRAVIWLARDSSTSGIVVASLVPGPRAAGLEPLVELRHEHAAVLLEVLDPDPDEIPDGEPVGEDARVAIAEYIEGRSLQQRVSAGPVGRDTAVDWIATVADVLATMHERGGVHGAVSPRAILAIRPALGQVPVLTQLLVPTSGTYCSPERVTGSGPSESDDTWALCASLYTALTRHVPFRGGSRTELARSILSGVVPPLEGVDEELGALVLRGLSRDRTARFPGAAELRNALRDWMDRSGAQIIGDFAPVDALVGPTEPPPNVGDLSLVAALARPDTAEANAPLEATTEFATFVEAEDLRAAASIPPVIGDVKRKPPPLPPSLSAKLPSIPSRPPAVSEKPLSIASRPALAEIRNFGGTVGSSPAPSTQMNAVASVAANGRWSTAAKAAGGFALGAALALLVFYVRTRDSGIAGPPSAAPSPTAPSATMQGTNAFPSPSAAVQVANLPVSSTASAPPPPAEDVNACSKALLPAGTLGEHPDLSYLCAGKEMWSLTLKTNLEVARHGHGDGMVSWVHLGRFDLAAVALIRSRCCPDAAPPRVATPKGMCEAIAQSVRDVSADPSPEHIDRYAADVDCIVHKGMTYPREWWDRIKPDEARQYFDQLVRGMPR